MRILMFTNQYGKTGNFVLGFTASDIEYHSIYPTNSIEATQDNIDKFRERCDAFKLQSVEYIDGLIKWSTAKDV